MKITKIKTSVGRTINTGKYESARIDIGAEATVGENENSADVINDLYIFLVEKLRDKVMKGEYE